MKRIARRAVPLSLLCLTLFATSASAEGAWVSWLHLTARATGGEEWFISVATDSLSDCLGVNRINVNDTVMERPLPDSDLARRYRRFREAGGVIRRLSAFSYEMTTGTGFTTVADLVCLPSDVDPRGPKGK